MKEFLSREGYTFAVKNVDEDHEAYEQLLAAGFRAVPVTFVGSHAVKGFDLAKLQEALQASGGSRSNR